MSGAPADASVAEVWQDRSGSNLAISFIINGFLSLEEKNYLYSINSFFFVLAASAAAAEDRTGSNWDPDFGNLIYIFYL